MIARPKFLQHFRHSAAMLGAEGPLAGLRTGSGRRRLWAWLCIAAALAIAAAILILLGISEVSLLLAALLLVCPALAAWMLLAGRRPLPLPIGPVPVTRGRTLDWLAPDYDWLCRLAGLGAAFRRRTLALAALRPGDTVLDVGCGTGVLTRLAADAVGPSGRAWGIDAAADMIRIARIDAARAGNAARFEPAAAENLPLESESCDVVLASLMVHCLPSDLKPRAFAEILRVLRPGGRIVVVDLDSNGPIGWRLPLWPLRLIDGPADVLEAGLVDLIRGTGFSDVRTAGRWGPLAFVVACKPQAEAPASRSGQQATVSIASSRNR